MDPNRKTALGASSGPFHSDGPVERKRPPRLTIVQYGDYAEAVTRFQAGEDETYYAQRYTVDFLADLASSAETEQVTVISFAADAPDQIAAPGIRTIGVDLYPRDGRARFDALLDAIAGSHPTHLVVASPICHAIRWGLRQKLPVLPLFADSFHASGLRGYIRNRRLARLLNNPAIDVVANHNLAASLDLARIGVNRSKIVPFDWPELISMQDYSPKSAPPANRPFRMLYAGQLTQAKGVGDAIRALAILRRRRRDVTLTLVGNGEAAAFETLAAKEGVAEHVTLAGRLPHGRVLDEMRAHDVVVVPSHHAYPEGLPMTLYEALCVRVPLIVSDHPMFTLRIRDGREALVHPERNAGALADRVERLVSDSRLYEEFSIRAETSVKNYLCPMKWDRLIKDFLDSASRYRLQYYSLAQYAYL